MKCWTLWEWQHHPTQRVVLCDASLTLSPRIWNIAKVNDNIGDMVTSGDTLSTVKKKRKPKAKARHQENSPSFLLTALQGILTALPPVMPL